MAESPMEHHTARDVARLFHDPIPLYPSTQAADSALSSHVINRDISRAIQYSLETYFPNSSGSSSPSSSTSIQSSNDDPLQHRQHRSELAGGPLPGNAGDRSYQYHALDAGFLERYESARAQAGGNSMVNLRQSFKASLKGIEPVCRIPFPFASLSIKRCKRDEAELHL